MRELKQAAVAPSKRRMLWKRYLPFYIMLVPGFVYLLINDYIPMFGLLLAFKKLDVRKGIWASPWVGLKNFEFLIKSGEAWSMIRNTLLFNVAFFIVGTVCAIALAILINELMSKIASKLYQTLILLPYLISWVIVSYLVYAFLSGDTGFINNTILKGLGLPPVQWYAETKYWPYILVMMNTWKGVGYSMIIYYSSIVGIGQDYYEAARLDGASKWQQVWQITLPLLKPTVITMFILNVGSVFRSDFSLFYQVPRDSGLLYPVTRTIDVYVYQALLKNADYGMSSAASLFQSMACFVLILLANWVVRRHQRESALF